MHTTSTFTNHAIKRCQQRGIPPFVVDLVLEHGRMSRRHKANCYYLDKKARRELKKELGGKIYARVEDQLNVYVIEEGDIVTVAHRLKRIKKN